MAYLLFNDNNNTLINKVGESIYLKTYPQKYTQKTNILAKSIYNDYCASIDNKNKIHLVYKTTQNSILHLHGKDSSFTSNILLDDSDNSYKITNLHILSKEKSYLFYAAFNPFENTTDLIFHNFEESSNSPQSLFSLPSLNSKYQSSIYGNYIYLLSCVLNNNSYELNLYSYNIVESTWDNYKNIITSEYPITDFSYVLHNDTVHITYVVDKFGHSTLYYGQYENNKFFEIEIIALGQKINPIIFIYNGIIWINYFTSQILYSSFSNNGGLTFSKPIKCTLQNNVIINIYLYGYKSKNLIGNAFLGYIDHQPNIAVLSQIDVDQILFYSTANTELKEVFKNPTTQSEEVSKNNRVEELEREINNLKEMQKSITQQYNDLANFARDVQYEGKKWRKKYQKLSKEMKNLNETKDNELTISHDVEAQDTVSLEWETEEIKPQQLKIEDKDITNESQ